MTWQETLQARRAALPYRVGETLIVTAGDFAGSSMRVARVDSESVSLQRMCDGVWTDFCTERTDIVRRFTRRTQ